MSGYNYVLDIGLIDTNPFAVMKIKAPKGATEEQDINPFSKEERDLIIRTFASDRYYVFETENPPQIEG